MIKKNQMTIKLIKSFLLFTLFLASTLTSNSAILHAEAAENMEPAITRYDGRSRENVAENVAQAHFKNSNKVILVNRDKFPDAISATNISQGRYPVLYTYSNKVSDSTLSLLKSMPLDEVYILGGPLSVNEAVENQLRNALGVKVTRVAGQNRYDANVSAVKENFNQANHVVIASGEVYADALYGVSYANTIHAPVVLTNTTAMRASTIALLKELQVKNATIIGGTLTVTSNVEQQLRSLGIHVNRIAGKNRYTGSAEVAEAAYTNPQNVVVASGEVFSDALVSAPLAQKLNAPILLVRANSMEQVVRDYILNNKGSIQNIYVQGGTQTVSAELFNTLWKPVTPQSQAPQLPQTPIPSHIQAILNTTDSVAYNKAKASNHRDLIALNNITEEEFQILFEAMDYDLLNAEFGKLINNHRAKLGRGKMTYDAEFKRGNQQIAKELADYGSIFIEGHGAHKRPNGQSTFSVFGAERNNVWSLGENLAYTMYSMVNPYQMISEQYLAERFFQIWLDSTSGHKEAMEATYYNGYTFMVHPTIRDDGWFTLIAVLTLTGR